MSIDIGKDTLDAFGLSDDDDEPSPKLSSLPSKPPQEPEPEFAPAQKPFIPPPKPLTSSNPSQTYLRRRDQKYHSKASIPSVSPVAPSVRPAEPNKMSKVVYTKKQSACPAAKGNPSSAPSKEESKPIKEDKKRTVENQEPIVYKKPINVYTQVVTKDDLYWARVRASRKRKREFQYVEPDLDIFNYKSEEAKINLLSEQNQDEFEGRRILENTGMEMLEEVQIQEKNGGEGDMEIEEKEQMGTTEESERREKPLNLVLDIDHTLIHSLSFQFMTNSKLTSIKNLYRDKWHEIWFIMNNLSVPQIQKHVIIVREGVEEFLSTVSQFWNLFVNTKGTKEYALSVIEVLDPDNKYGLKDKLQSKSDEVETEDRKQIK